MSRPSSGIWFTILGSWSLEAGKLSGQMYQIFWAGTIAAVAVILVISNKLDVIWVVPIFAAVPIAILAGSGTAP